jgi:hypothetical protein
MAYVPNQTEWTINDIIRQNSQAQAVGMPGMTNDQVGSAIGAAQKAALDRNMQNRIAQKQISQEGARLEIAKDAQENQESQQTSQGIGSAISGINSARMADKQLALTEKLYSGLFGAGGQTGGLAGVGGGLAGSVAPGGALAGAGTIGGGQALLGTGAGAIGSAGASGLTTAMGGATVGGMTGAFGAGTAGAGIASAAGTAGIGSAMGAGMGAGVAGGLGAGVGAGVGAGAGTGMMAGMGAGLAAMGPFALIPLAMGAVYMGLQAFGVFGKKEGGAGGTIVCTELHRQGKIPYRTKMLDHKFGASLSLETMAGYHMLFTPVVRGMRKSKTFSNIVGIFLIPVAKDMASRVSHLHRPNRFGRIMTNILLPICEATGLLMSKREVLKWA